MNARRSAAVALLFVLPTFAQTPRPPEAPIDENGCPDGRILEYKLRHGIGGRVDPELLLDATRAYKAEHDSQRASGRWVQLGVGGTVWTSIGPNNGGGRMTSIATHPTTPGTILMGAAGGGVWKSTDSGATWSVLTDSLSNLAIGAVAYAPSDPTKIYAGTGENAYNGDGITGIGLLYSSDGGTNWTLPSTVIASNFFRISVHPTTPTEIVAGTSSGLLRSTAGQNGPWTNPPSINHDSSGVTKSYGDVADVARDPSNPSILYATTYDRDYWCDHYGGCSNPWNYYSPRVMKSTDGGATWSLASTNLPTSTATMQVGRMSIAIAPSSTSTLYLSFATYDSTTGITTSHIYKSTDSAGSWSETALSSNGSTSISRYLSNQGWYGNAIVVSPSNANIVFAGGVPYVTTTDGGTTWSAAFTTGGVHVDCHDLRYNADGTTLFIANDGGAYTYTVSGGTITNRNANLVTRQFYTLAMDPANRNRMFGGLQDNGTLRRPDAAGTSWDTAFGGDGFDVTINQDSPSLVMMSWQYGNIIRTPNAGGSTFITAYKNPPWPGGESAPFWTKVVSDPNNQSTLYTATYRLWKTTAFGSGWAPMATTTTDGSTWSAFQGVSSLAIAPSDSNTIYVAKYDKLFKSTNGGTSWVQIITGLPSGRNINSIAIDPANASTAYVALAGTTTNSVYYTTNGGTSWTARGSGLPLFSAQCVRVDPTDSTTLYCGTDVGVYRSTNSGATWSAYGTGMPSVSVYDVQILKDGTKLRAATHGRGVWELTVTSPSNNAPTVSASSTPAAVSGVVSITAGTSVTFSGTFSDADGDAMTANWFFPDDVSFTTATSGGSTAHTFYRAGRYPVTLKVVDSKGGIGAATIDVSVAELADACSTAVVIPPSGPFPYTITVDGTSGSVQGSDPVGNNCDPYTYDTSMWFSFTPPSTQSYILSLAGSQLTSILVVYTGTVCGTLTQVASGCFGRQLLSHTDSNLDASAAASKMTITLTAGTTYTFLLTNYYSQDTGIQSLTISPTATGINEAVYEVGPAIGTTSGGKSVTLYGYNFQSGATVSFGGTAATSVVVVNGNIITCTTPAHSSGTVDVAVTSGGNTATLKGGYTYVTPAPAAPTNVVATATTSTNVQISWTASSGADSYQVYRSANAATYSLAGTLVSSASGTLSLNDATASANTAYLYKVVALTGSSPSTDSSVDLATTTIFTDDPLVTTSTQIKATHLTQLRTAINAVRTLASLGAATVTDGSPSGVNVKAIHITELRTALAAARSPLGLPALTFTHNTLTAQSTQVYAVDFTELRNGVK